MDNVFKQGCAAFAKPITTVKRLDFDLDAARAGVAIEMKSGRPAEFIAFCERAIFPLVVLTGPNNEIHVYRADGTTPDGDEYALVMVVPAVTRYVNLFADGNHGVRGTGDHYPTAEEAETEARNWTACGGTPMLAVAVPVEVPVRSA
jgi:hypothetical protein